MEMLSAKIVRKGEDQYLCLTLPKSMVEIPLTVDSPSAVRTAFNKLVVELKVEPISFAFEKAGDDLFQQIGEEYVKQLNNEVKLVRKDLEEYEMVDAETE